MSKRRISVMPDQQPAPWRFTRWQIVIGVGLLIGVAIVTAIILGSPQPNTPTSNPQNATTSGDIEGLQAFLGIEAGHVTTKVNYPQTPPVGGVHNPVWQQCGVYTEPIANEHAVHSLEHGAVWITYQPDLPSDQIEALQAITQRSDHRLLSPYPGIDSPIILSAWGYQLRVTRADDPRVAQFIQRFEQGVTTPERGATCSGGETRTLAQLGAGG